MHTKQELVDALKEPYTKALRASYSGSGEMSYEAAWEVLAAIEEIAVKLGVIHELQSTV